MSQDTLPAPFNLGDRVRYIGVKKREVRLGGRQEQVLAPGMEGVILLSTGAFPEQGPKAGAPWHCQVQFHNGFQLDITPENYSDFEVAHEAGSPTATARE